MSVRRLCHGGRDARRRQVPGERCGGAGRRGQQWLLSRRGHVRVLRRQLLVRVARHGLHLADICSVCAVVALVHLLDAVSRMP